MQGWGWAAPHLTTCGMAHQTSTLLSPERRHRTLVVRSIARFLRQLASEPAFPSEAPVAAVTAAAVAVATGAVAPSATEVADPLAEEAAGHQAEVAQAT